VEGCEYMTTADDLRDFFGDLDYKVIIAADGETRTHQRKGERIIEQTPAGGVSVAFDVLCQAAGATYIARARTPEDREVTDADGAVTIDGPDGHYCLKRLVLTPEEEEAYYAGFANQTLWPLCHIAFERPIFNRAWFEGYAEVNRRFAESIQQELTDRSFVWLNDYHLALAASSLRKRSDTVIGLFWHIPWPTWEIFRILPYKREILHGLLSCDFIAFHRRYQARNFLNAVDQELGARIDFETNTVYVDGKSVRVASLPMGIDVDVIRQAFMHDDERPTLLDTIRSTFGFSVPADGSEDQRDDTLAELRDRYRILLGVDRLDYTKGIPERLMGIDQFFAEYPSYRQKVVYVGIMSPTRNAIPAYQALRERVEQLADEINAKYRTDEWAPLHMVYDGFTRDDVMDLYRDASVCLVTPVDDGMNLVSKEFVVAASCSLNPGMLVLSQFAGSASDLSASLLVNPYDTGAVATAIKLALEMDRAERVERITHMASLLEERNVYEWAMNFVRDAATAAREQQHGILQIL
jgi:trehalose-6-phosphate synthase